MGVKKVCEKIILIIITISLLITFIATPSSYAKLDLQDGEFYYSGTTKGSYTVKDGIFSWLLSNLSQIADWILGLITMGVRMVFVGWTALIERLLTWALETTTGVNINGDGVESSTDLSSITDSSSNITVQAIVYNQVPAFDINFFNIEYDPTVSGTGHIYVCEKCNKECSDSSCCGTSADSCACACKGKCDACESYLAALKVKANVDSAPPVVIQLKTLVSQWYYVLRMLSLAAMLIVLIGIGIKMAISTVASEKAVYKRMLVDWVAGTIILFTAHYMMWFVIQVNESLVNVIKDSANSINQVQLKQLYDKNGTSGERSEVTDEEIEIDVYEAIRTRAYDAKLSVGLSGMIMYMALVYFAIRYTLIYLKRYLTLVVLTLMGPPVGVAYAFQKAMSGKSSTFKAWLTEYIMNVIIQSVHALIYAVFISEALVLSLESIAGMIVALIIMNFSLKAEKLFRQVFKMSSEGSLLENASQAGDAEKIKSNLNTAKGLYMGAKPVTNALLNTPYAKALKGVGKAGIAGAGALASAISKSSEGGNSEESSLDDNEETGSENATSIPVGTSAGISGNNSSSEPVSAETGNEVLSTTKQGMVKGEDNLRANVASKLVAYSDAPEDKKESAGKELSAAFGEYKNHRELELPTMKDIIKGHKERVVDIDNHFQLTPTSGSANFSADELKRVKASNAKNIINGIFGTEYYDSKTGAWVQNKNGYYNQFSSENLLGFTEADKKVFKEHVINPIRNGFGGIASTFVGMGMLVANPQMGMAMLASGKVLRDKTFKKPANDKAYKGKYTFSRFSVPAARTIQKETIARANREIQAISSDADSQMVERVKQDHPDLYDALKADFHKDMKSEKFTDKLVKDLKRGGIAGATAVTFGVVAGAGTASIIPAATVASAGFMAQKFVAHTGISSHLEAVEKHVAKQAKDQQLQFMQDGLNVQAGMEQGEFEHKMKVQEQEEAKKLYEELGFDYNPETGEPIEKSDSKKAEAEYNKEIIALYAAQGLKYNPKNGTLIPLTPDEKEKANKESSVEGVGTKDGNEPFTNKDNETLNKEIDNVIEQLVNKYDGNLDMSSQKVQNEAIKALSDNLAKQKILADDQSVEDVIKGGKNKLVSSLKQKANAENAEYILDKANLSDEDKTKIKETVAQIASEKNNNFSEVKASEVLSIVKPSDGNKQAVDKSGKPISNSDGSKSVAGMTDREIAITSYLSHMQKSQPVPPSKNSKNIKDAKRIVEQKTKNRKKKIEQILSLDIQDDNPEVGNVTDSAIATASEIKDGKNKTFKGKNGTEITLNSSEASDVLELLLMRKELEQINEYAEKQLEIKKGNRDYQNQIKRKSQDAVDYYRAKLEIENMKLADPTLTYDKDKIAKIKNEADRNTIIKKQESLEKNVSKLKSLEEKKKASEREMVAKGPIVNVDSFISESFKTNKRK
jgi:hypothetical protein